MLTLILKTSQQGRHFYSKAVVASPPGGGWSPRWLPSFPSLPAGAPAPPHRRWVPVPLSSNMDWSWWIPRPPECGRSAVLGLLGLGLKKPCRFCLGLLNHSFLGCFLSESSCHAMRSRNHWRAMRSCLSQTLSRQSPSTASHVSKPLWTCHPSILQMALAPNDTWETPRENHPAEPSQRTELCKIINCSVTLLSFGVFCFAVNIVLCC